MTYDATMALRDYLADGYQSALDALAATKGLKFTRITDWSVGWSDPFALPRYPAALIVPDGADRRVEEQLITLPLWVFLANRHNDPQILAAWQLLAIDAAYEYVNGANIALWTHLDEATPYTPTAGIAVVELRINTQINILGGYNG